VLQRFNIRVRVEDVAAMIVKYGDEGGDQSRLNWGRFVDRIVPRDYTTRVSQHSVNIQSTFSQLHSVNHIQSTIFSQHSTLYEEPDV
jgi:hypothetical protein